MPDNSDFENISKEELIHALEASRVGVWRWDVATGKIFWSDFLQKLYGLKPGEFQGSFEHYTNLIHPDDRERCQAIVQKAIQNREPYDMEHRTWGPDGSSRWLSGRGQAFFDNHGNLIKMTGVSVDITDRKNQEEALAKKTVELERFAAIAAHDLRAPLNSITQFTELLASQYQGKLGADADEYIDFIINAGNRMRNFIDSLLTYAKSGTLHSRDLKPVNLNDVMGNVRKNLFSEIRETDARILTQGHLPTVLGHETQLTQLMQNLISNSIKFRKPNQSPQISVSAERSDSKWKVVLEDNGQGIEARNLPLIFDFLRRFHSHDQEGTGIGLAVCKKIIESHGGTIEAESEPGKGSKFCFTLPERTETLQ